MFAGNRRGLTFHMKEGDNVVVTGSIEVYERDGKYQLYAREITLAGAGNLYLKYEALKKELEEMGMFAKEYKQDIPKYAKTIGIVTAPTGAAVRDINNIAQRRNPYVQLILYPALVQGENAANSVCRAIQAAERDSCDVLIVGRGGGAAEDLQAFNTEAVIMAIYHCTIPVVSAVGHETDWTLADAAADLRAPTPSAAAELAVPDVQHLMQTVQELGRRQEAAAIRIFQQKEQELRRMQDKLLLASPQQRQQAAQLELQHIRERLEHGINRTLERCSTQLMQQAERLDMLSPLKILGRGYALVYHGEDLIHSGAQVQTGDLLRIQLAQESVYARVVEEKEGTGHGI